MIHLGKHIYINPLTIILFVFCFVMHRTVMISTAYAVMTVHELAHLAAALAIGLKPSHISFQPFGVNLRLKNKIVYSLADEIILYAAGPLCNIVLALGAAVVFPYFPYEELRMFYAGNILLFCVNMLPITPLDGGMILKKILSRRFGSRNAEKTLRVVSALLTVILIVFGAYVVYITKLNFSVLFFAVFLAGNIFTQNEKYNIDLIKELMYYKNKPRNRVRLIIADDSDEPLKIAERLAPDRYSVICITDKSGKIKELLTETQIIEKIIASAPSSKIM